MRGSRSTAQQFGGECALLNKESTKLSFDNFAGFTAYRGFLFNLVRMYRSRSTAQHVQKCGMNTTIPNSLGNFAEPLGPLSWATSYPG